MSKKNFLLNRYVMYGISKSNLLFSPISYYLERLLLVGVLLMIVSCNPDKCCTPPDDNKAPVISLVGDNPQTIKKNKTYIELGATTDDGSSIIINSHVNINKVGTYSVTYDATDDAGNRAEQVIRTVKVIDTTAPVISLVGDNPQTIKKNKTYIELGATIDDGSSIIINSHVNINKVGTYSVTYDATDDAGNRAEQVIRTVKVIDTTVPVINLLGNNPQNIEKSTAYIELGAATDDGSSIIINSHVNINTVGTYSVTYDATDDAGNKAKQVIRTVFILPHMTISSSNNVVVYVDSDFDKKVTIWHKNFKIKHISKYLYRRFNDDFDFIFLISNNLTSPDTISYAGVYSSVSNNVKGLGKAIFDDTEMHGSKGKLKGIMHFPYRNIYHGPSLHEIMHTWANSIFNTATGSHWGYTGFFNITSPSALGMLGGYDASTFIHEGNGLYSASRFWKIGNYGSKNYRGSFNDVELYLMGLIGKSSVGSIITAENATSISETESRIFFSADNVVRWEFSELLKNLGIEDRIPNVNNAQKHFRILTVLCSDSRPTQKEINEVEKAISRITYPAYDDSSDDHFNFYEATGGRATLKSDGLSSSLIK